MKRDHVAVIAVHGVGDQKPFETAREIAALLQDLDQPDPQRVEAPQPCRPPSAVTPQYGAFASRSIRLDVRPVVVRPEPEMPAAVSPSIHGPFHDWVSSRVQARQDGTPVARADLSAVFMRGQLSCAADRAPEDAYETERLEGCRQDGDRSRDVHVYELYWADLSRLKAGMLSIFTELYQLLFHVPSLGTHAVDAEADHHAFRSWRAFRVLQGRAATFLTVHVMALQLALLAIVGVGVALKGLYWLRPEVQTVVVGIATSLIAVGFAGWRLWRRPVLSWASWFTPIGLFVVFVIVLLATSRRVPIQLTHGAAAAILAGGAAWLFSLVFGVYDDRRPDAHRIGCFLAMSSVALGGIACLGAPPQQPPTSRILFALTRLFEISNAFLTLIWLVFAFTAMVAFLVGMWAVAGVDNPREKDLARRTNWTARLTLGIPAAVLLLVTLTGWGVLALVLQPLFAGVSYEPFFTPLRSATTVDALIDAFLRNGPWLVLPMLLTASAFAAVPALWGLAPVVLAEAFPPSLFAARRGTYGRRLGQWLTRAFQGLTLSGALLYSVVIFVFSPMQMLVLTQVTPLPDALQRGIRATGLTTGVLLAWLFSMRSSLKKATLGARPVLDILLDVDNWLRELPRARNPRAKICARYASLLRQVCGWTDPVTGDGYRAIVIVAHSQGAVITADLLRFLAIEPDPQLARLGGAGLPIYLFTMGCPLRQLYGRRFPRLYAWAAHDDRTMMSAWEADDLVNPVRPPAAPDPEALRVRTWVNAYRSGDYVGRYLWRTDSCAYAWDADFFGPAPCRNSTDGGSRVEFCIGGGAHTHYWDGTARPIAWALDRLIADA